MSFRAHNSDLSLLGTVLGMAINRWLFTSEEISFQFVGDLSEEYYLGRSASSMKASVWKTEVLTITQRLRRK